MRQADCYVAEAGCCDLGHLWRRWGFRWTYPTFAIDESLDPTALRAAQAPVAPSSRPPKMRPREPKAPWTALRFAESFSGTGAATAGRDPGGGRAGWRFRRVWPSSCWPLATQQSLAHRWRMAKSQRGLFRRDSAVFHNRGEAMKPMCVCIQRTPPTPPHTATSAYGAGVCLRKTDTRWTLTFRPEGDGPPAEVRIRRLLKDAIRRHRLRCVDVVTSESSEPIASTHQQGPGRTARHRPDPRAVRSIRTRQRAKEQ